MTMKTNVYACVMVLVLLEENVVCYKLERDIPKLSAVKGEDGLNIKGGRRMKRQSYENYYPAFTDIDKEENSYKPAERYDQNPSYSSYDGFQYNPLQHNEQSAQEWPISSNFHHAYNPMANTHHHPTSGIGGSAQSKGNEFVQLTPYDAFAAHSNAFGRESPHLNDYYTQYVKRSNPEENFNNNLIDDVFQGKYPLPTYGQSAVSETDENPSSNINRLSYRNPYPSNYGNEDPAGNWAHVDAFKRNPDNTNAYANPLSPYHSLYHNVYDMQNFYDDQYAQLNPHANYGARTKKYVKLMKPVRRILVESPRLLDDDDGSIQAKIESLRALMSDKQGKMK